MSKKKILIIGGTSGLGSQILRNIDRTKYEVSITGRNYKIKDHEFFFYKLDVLKKNKFKKFITEISKKNFDIIIHSLGGSYGINGHDQESKNYEKLFKLNFFYMVDINKAMLPIMKKRGWGRIVHISSATSYNL